MFFKAGSVFGQQQIIFNKVLPPEGETFYHVIGIAQSEDGYMWLATKRGLFRYDGYQMLAYKNVPSDPNSLASDTLGSISIDATGKIWIGTLGSGLERFDPATGNFEHYRHNPKNPGSLISDWVNVVLVDHDGIIWVGTGEGLDRYDSHTDSFIHYQNKPGDSKSLSYNEVVAIYEDRQGIIWIGTGSVYGEDKDNLEKGGLNRLNKKNGTFTRYMHIPDNPHSLINNKVFAIFEDSKGTFWVGTSGDGLHTMNRANGTFERHLYDPAHPEKLSRPPLNKENQQFDFITFIKEDTTGALWIGTSQSGINYYNPKTGRTTSLESNKNFESGYDDNTSWFWYSSREGVIWIGTMNGNLYRIDPFRGEIPHYKTLSGPVNAFYEEPNGILWIGTGKELIRNDKAKGIIKRDRIDLDLSTTADNHVSIIKEDRHGNVWIGSKEGLTQWIKAKEKFINYKIDAKIKRSSGTDVWSIYEDGDVNLWIGKGNGLSLLNRNTGIITQFLIYPRDTNQYGKNSVTSILRDKIGKLWIGTWFGGGLNQFDKENNTFKNYLKGKDVSCIFEDSSGILWVGCWDELYKFERKSDKFIPSSDSISLSGISRIRSIIEDNQKYLWIASSNGIVRINPLRNSTKIYDKNSSINGNELVWNACYKGRDGKLYFGDNTGYFSFNPNELPENNKPPEIIIEDFRLSDQVVKPGNQGPLKESLSLTNEIVLHYNQNVFSFDFAAIDYINPEANRHLFILENYDNNWHKASSERRAYYFNVPPGKYIFRVRAANSYGIWAERKISIIILPPWWRTWLAYCIYGLLFITTIFGVDRFQRRRLLKAERERNREREFAHAKEMEKAYTELKATQSQLIQSEKMASLGELTAGIAHEIQNPLNFVNNFSEVNKELLAEMNTEIEKGNFDEVKALAKDVADNEEKINHHGKRADAIVKGMLLHSRSSSGIKEPTDVNALADEYLRLAYHGLRAKDKSFNATMKTDFDKSIGFINIIPQDIGRVILNLITNAFYAVDEKKQQLAKDLSGFQTLTGLNGYEPTVSVSTGRSLSSGEGRGEVKISVKDNGNGIPQKVLDKIFQPFFTTKPSGQGTGLGLSMSYEIVTKGHGGELKVDTKEGEGAEFTIILKV